MSYNIKSVNYVIDEIISDLGYYSPLELLLRQRRLRYSDYERWRNGEIDFICETFMGSSKRINDLLESARDYVQALGFVADTYYLSGWSGKKANSRLKFCPAVNVIQGNLLSTQYLPQEDVPQMDLFFDNQGVQLANGLIQALSSRDVKASEKKLKQLKQVDSSHPLCGNGEKLLFAIQKLQQTNSLCDTKQELNYLQQQLAPKAKDVLKGVARDFMAPFWRRLALNLDAGLYDEKNPDLNVVYCYAQILLWSEVIDAVYDIPQWQQYADLFSQLTHAYYQNNQRIESIQVLCDYCWLYPDADSFLPDDNKSVKAWQKFTDLDLDEKWGWKHFPVWLLFNEPGLAKHIQVNSSSGASAFKALQQLLQAEQDKGEVNVDLRLKLQSTHKGIFNYFLNRQV